MRPSTFRSAPFSLLGPILALSLPACGDASNPAAGGGSPNGGNAAALGGSASVGSGTSVGGGPSVGGNGQPVGGSDPSGGGPPSAGGDSGISGNYAVSPFIVVDQFGYLEDAEKIAVLRDPERGFDQDEAYVAGSNYQLVDSNSGQMVLALTPVAWGGGAVHDQSGDKASWLDFSSFKTPGNYFVLDVDAGVRSDVFLIGTEVYREVFRHALRTFFYQRAGFEKATPFAEEGWTDAASHIGPGQDKNARLYGETGDAATERDLSGGWYDAGDYNRYTAWSGDYVATLLRMFEERPEIFGDDLNIPESGNGVPDVLDEARFGLEQLKRTQSESGGCLSVLGTDPQYASASPPSALTEPAVYGPETTNATLRAGIAFAFGARVYADSDADYSADLLARAQRAWAFAEANPDLVFENTGKIAAGEQQASAADVALYKLGLAVSLYRASGEASYKEFFEQNYASADLQMLDGYNAGWQLQFTEYYLDYAALPDADAAIAEEIQGAFVDTMGSDQNLGMVEQNPDPYLGYVDTYTWGSNAHKSRTGCLFYDLITFELAPDEASRARIGAERYLHYLHGVNPLGLVFLTNMGKAGAESSANSLYHAWFVDKSAEWDEVGVSTYGPAPGFLTGGPNPGYELDASCPAQDGCPATPPAPPSGQPDQKSYLDFNDGWPVNSWSVTENSNGYQTYYLRLLSKFVN